MGNVWCIQYLHDWFLDGKKIISEIGKHYYTTGSIYAAQTFTNIPDLMGEESR